MNKNYENPEKRAVEIETDVAPSSKERFSESLDELVLRLTCNTEKETFCAKHNREMEEKPLTKIYLAIPYSGIEESSYTQATEATMIIINEMGHNVFSPITHSHPIAKLGMKGTWDYWQKIDYQFIDWADEMWILIPKEGLVKVLTSTGVVAETKYALENKKKVKFITIIEDKIRFL